RSEPVLRTLGSEGLHEVIDLAPCGRFVKRDEAVRLNHQPLVLWNLVLEDPVAAKRVPRQLCDDPVILMVVFTAVGEDEAWRHEPLEPLELVLDLGQCRWEVAVPETMNHHVALFHTLKEQLRRPCGLFGPDASASEYDPPH